MPADGVALRFVDVVDCEGSRNSRKQSNMEVAWVSVEKACISFHQTTAWCVHPPTMDIELRKLIINSFTTRYLCLDTALLSAPLTKQTPSDAPTATHVTRMSSIHPTQLHVTTPSDACVEEECAICFEAMSEDTAVIMPGCTHMFHGQCLW